MKLKFSPLHGLLAVAMGFSGAAMAGVTDATGDWASNYTAAKTNDLDVVSSFVSYDPATHMFTVSGTMLGSIVSGGTARYIWGFDRGSATNAPFAVAPGVKFDTTVSLNADGTGTVAGAALAGGTVMINGTTISASFSDSLLAPTTSGVSYGGYTWNLWPRFANQIPDFAPDNAMAAVDVVPEPGTWAMMALGLGGLVLLARRRRQA